MVYAYHAGMDNNVYITLSRQLALFRDMEQTANNIANVNTTGYQASHIMFSSYMVNDGLKNEMAFAHDVSNFRDTSKGTFQTTDNPLDLAIAGDGYFVVDTPLGERYTRAGNFQIDAEGVLISAEGYPVLDQNRQPITFTQEDKEIMIGAGGNINVDGEERGVLAMVSFENEQMLERVGDRLFSVPEDVIAQPSVDSRMLQGTLEGSNVQAVKEMTHIIKISRAVGNTSKFIEVMYDLQRKNTSAWTRQA